MTQPDEETADHPQALLTTTSPAALEVTEVEKPVLVVVNEKTHPDLFRQVQQRHDQTTFNKDGSFNEGAFGGHPMVSEVDRSMEFHLFQDEFEQLSGQEGQKTEVPVQKVSQPTITEDLTPDERIAELAKNLENTAQNSNTLVRVEQGKSSEKRVSQNLTVNLKGSGTGVFENVPVKIDRELFKGGEARYLLVKSFDRKSGEYSYEFGLISKNTDSSISYQALNEGERDILLSQITRGLKRDGVVPPVHPLGVLKETKIGKEVLTGAFMKPEPLSFKDAQREMELPGQKKEPNKLIEESLKYL